MKHRPIIGITPGWQKGEETMALRNTYVNAIIDSGGAPVILPITESREALSLYADLCDGFIFSGGVDVSPDLYGEEVLDYCGEIQPQRDAMEFGLLKLIMLKDKPVLGICRGAQVMNVALNGTLFQDIPAQRPDALNIAHWQKKPFDYGTHIVKIEKESLLYNIVGKEALYVNSMHHQGMKSVGDNVLAAAHAPCGLIEAIEGKAHKFFLGVEWHPEYLYQKDPTQKNIFEAFIQACTQPK